MHTTHTQTTYTFTQVTPDLPFIHPSEVSLLNRICQLGTYYLQLKGFISEQNAASITLTPKSEDGKTAGDLTMKLLLFLNLQRATSK